MCCTCQSAAQRYSQFCNCKPNSGQGQHPLVKIVLGIYANTVMPVIGYLHRLLRGIEDLCLGGARPEVLDAGSRSCEKP